MRSGPSTPSPEWQQPMHHTLVESKLDYDGFMLGGMVVATASTYAYTHGGCSPLVF